MQDHWVDRATARTRQRKVYRPHNSTPGKLSIQYRAPRSHLGSVHLAVCCASQSFEKGFYAFGGRTGCGVQGVQEPREGVPKMLPDDDDVFKMDMFGGTMLRRASAVVRSTSWYCVWSACF